MINKITFTGREECLGPIKKGAKQVAGYISDGALVPEMKEKATASAEEKFMANINEAYKAAHAPYLDAPAKKDINPDVVMDGQIF